MQQPNDSNIAKPSAQYKAYLEKMQKEIHDDKMKRFVEHTQKLDKVVPESPPPRREVKRVDTGLRKEN